MGNRDIEQIRARSILKRHGFTFKKKYGQNFLTDPGILDDIVEAAQVSDEDWVVEIGAGMGTLTERLATAAAGVCAIEKDYDLMPILEERFAPPHPGHDKIRLVQGDILDMPMTGEYWESLTAEGARIKVVANLPYYITTPIVTGLLEGNMPYTSITVMVQKEVAERMTAQPGSKAYGALTLLAAYHTDTRICFTLPPEAFYPPPKVESAVVTMVRYDRPPVEAADEELLFTLIRAAFNQRRKTLVNALSAGAHLSMDKEAIAGAIREAGFDDRVRGEVLSLADYAALTKLLS